MIINNNPLLNLLSNNFGGAAQRGGMPSRDASARASLEQTMRGMTADIGNSLNAHDVSRETVDLNSIWQRGRDWGMNPQMDMAIESKNIALRASNDATMSDRARAVMNMEIQGMQKETTRIGLTNKVHGHPTLAEFGVVTEETKVIEKVPTQNEEQETNTQQLPRFDVLWVLDRTGSMGDDVQKIKDAAPKMYEELKNKGYDVRMAAVSFEANVDPGGSPDFRSNFSDFQGDLNGILNNINGGYERGLTSLTEAAERFNGKFSNTNTTGTGVFNAAATVMITDEPTNDTGYYTSNNNEPDKISTEAGGEELRKKAADAVKQSGSELFVVGSGYFSNMPDEDYQDVVKKVGGGGSLSLDNNGDWVTQITDKFKGLADKTTEKTRTTYGETTVERTITTKTYKLKDEWDLRFQAGPGAGDQITERFKTMTAETSGLIKADVTTGEKAREAISHAGSAIDFINTAKTQIGSLQTRFSSIADTLASSSISKRQNSIFPSAVNTYKNTDILASLAQNYRDKSAGIY